MHTKNPIVYFKGLWTYCHSINSSHIHKSQDNYTWKCLNGFIGHMNTIPTLLAMSSLKKIIKNAYEELISLIQGLLNTLCIQLTIPHIHKSQNNYTRKCPNGFLWHMNTLPTLSTLPYIQKNQLKYTWKCPNGLPRHMNTLHTLLAMSSFTNLTKSWIAYFKGSWTQCPLN